MQTTGVDSAALVLGGLFTALFWIIVAVAVVMTPIRLYQIAKELRFLNLRTQKLLEVNEVHSRLLAAIAGALTEVRDSTLGRKVAEPLKATK